MSFDDKIADQGLRTSKSTLNDVEVGYVGEEIGSTRSIGISCFCCMVRPGRCPSFSIGTGPIGQWHCDHLARFCGERVAVLVRAHFVGFFGRERLIGRRGSGGLYLLRYTFELQPSIKKSKNLVTRIRIDDNDRAPRDGILSAD